MASCSDCLGGGEWTEGYTEKFQLIKWESFMTLYLVAGVGVDSVVE